MVFQEDKDQGDPLDRQGQEPLMESQEYQEERVREVCPDSWVSLDDQGVPERLDFPVRKDFPETVGEMDFLDLLDRLDRKVTEETLAVLVLQALVL